MKMPADSSEFPNNDYYHPVTIGSLTTRGNLFFAPMAGYTDCNTRLMGYLGGADLCFTEMISCEALVRGNDRSQKMLTRWSPDLFDNSLFAPQFEQPLKNFTEENLYIQVFTASESTAEQAVELLNTEYCPSLIDLNCGCPMPKICNSGAGSSLMSSPRLVGAIIKHMKAAADCPVTLKMRSGLDSSSINYLDVIDQAIEAGIDAICLHPRTREQMYSGSSEWAHIKKAVEHVNGAVPVFGNGDLYTVEDAVRMFNTTGCDGVLFARGAMGNPEIFRQTKEKLQKNQYSIQEHPSRIAYARQHLKLAVDFYGEKLGTTSMKKILASYVKGIHGGPELRHALVTSATSKEMISILDAIMNKPIT